MEKAKIVLLYADKYYLIKQVYPMGLDLIAQHLIRRGHEVTVEYPFLPEPGLKENLMHILQKTDPDLVGLGIRNLDTCMSGETYGDYEGDDYRTFFFLPHVKRVVDAIRAARPELPIIAGGGAFTITPQAVMAYLGIEYGVVGEGEVPLLQFIEAFPDRDRIARIPSLLCKRDGGYIANPRKGYGFQENTWSDGRESKFHYAFETNGIPVQVKRGCNQTCSYCVEPIIEGNRYIYREIEDIIGELMKISERCPGVSTIFFVDTEFNLPDLHHGSRLVKRIMEEGLHQRFRFTSQFLPRPFTREFGRLLSKGGFSVILTCDSFSDAVLKRNGMSYGQTDIVGTLEICEEFGIGCTVAMIFGLPGESYGTIDYSIEQMKVFPPHMLRQYEYTVGGRIYRGTPLCRLVQGGREEMHLYGNRSKGFLEPYYYCSPKSPMKLKEYIESALGHQVAYENFYDDNRFQVLAVSYLVDQGRWEEALAQFAGANLTVRTTSYDYYFRKLTEAGRVDEARRVSLGLLNEIEGGQEGEYRDQGDLIRFYLSQLG